MSSCRTVGSTGSSDGPGRAERAGEGEEGSAMATGGDPKDPFDHLAAIRAAANEIAHGNYAVSQELDRITSSPDVPAEVQALAEAVNFMALKVEAREFQLSGLVDDLKEANRRVAALADRLANENRLLKAGAEQMRIVIDHDESDREVEEIASSDYFRTLRDKARTLRGEGTAPGQRRGAGGPGKAD